MKLAARVLLGINLFVIIFHFAALSGVVPREYVWGGRLQTQEELYVFELISLSVNLVFGVLILWRAGMVQSFVPLGVVRFLLWVFVAVFLLTTVGNLFSQSLVEMIFGSIGTATLAVLTTYVNRGSSN